MWRVSTTTIGEALAFLADQGRGRFSLKQLLPDKCPGLERTVKPERVVLAVSRRAGIMLALK
jgi:hypothetical protein